MKGIKEPQSESVREIKPKNICKSCGIREVDNNYRKAELCDVCLDEYNSKQVAKILDVFS